MGAGPLQKAAYGMRALGGGTRKTEAMALHTDQMEDGTGLKGMWDHELIIACFTRVLGQPFEREGLERDDQWVKYKVEAADEVINSNLILDYGRDAGHGDWEATDKAGANYLAFTFGCQLWLDYPTPAEIKDHVDKGLKHLHVRMAEDEGGIVEDNMDGGRRKIYFEREALFDLGAHPDDVTRETLAWAKTALADIGVAAEHIVYSE